jgi:hypothetical protein
MKRILVIGSAGSIGRALIKQLRDSYLVEGLDKNFSIDTYYKVDITSTLNIKTAYDTVIHLADVNSENIVECNRTNIIGTINILENLKYDNFILASTIDDTDSSYTLTKKISEKLVVHSCKSYSIFKLCDNVNIIEACNQIQAAIENPVGIRSINITNVETNKPIAIISDVRKRVLLVKPKLDVSFSGKKTDIPKVDVKYQKDPVRLLWGDFIRNLENEYISRPNVDFDVLEVPLYLLGPKQIDTAKYDIVFIPHKEQVNFQLKDVQVYYYMQCAIPWLFSVDRKGWGGGASVYPYDCLFTSEADPRAFNTFRSLALNNSSKYDQPEYQDLKLPENYVLFLCQIPHDETIKYHSKVEVGKALIYTCLATEKLGLPLVVKAHPKRPDLMKGLYLSIQKFKHMTWVSKVSVHQLIEKSRCVVTVNSGAGMEALFHKKPVITFGSAEYDCVTIPATKDTIEQAILEAGYDEERVIKFFDSWYRWCYDVSDSSTFTKLP